MGLSPVTSDNWQLTRVFPRAMQSPICNLWPIWMRSSGREKSVWRERWRKSKLVIVGPKKRVKEIVLTTSWAVWKKRLDVNLKDSRLRTSCNVQIYCQRLYWSCGRYSWFAIVLVLILHIPLAFLLRINMVAIHILHKLVLNARLFMKMASWGFVF